MDQINPKDLVYAEVLHNLSLTSEERFLKHQAALDLLITIQNIGQNHHAKFKSITQNPA